LLETVIVYLGTSKYLYLIFSLQFSYFFQPGRSIADQLEGDPNRYAEYRAAICNFIEQHREDYEPFIEDDQTFDKVKFRSKSGSVRN
jgi:hypothetical protein